MPKITFLPMNIVCEAAKGDSILDVAIQNDIPIQHACGGFCACTTCHVLVQTPEKTLSKMDEDEADRLERMGDCLELNSRLGCQAKIYQDTVVQVVNIES